MFIYRSFTPSLPVYNRILGDSYLVIYKDVNTADFARAAENFYPDPVDIPESLSGFLSFQDGSELLPLYKDRVAYIMTSTGATFEKIRS